MAAPSKTSPSVVATNSSTESLVLQSAEGGRTTIQPHVVAKIAGLAVREISGVHALVPFGAGQAIANLAKTVARQDFRDLGVNVEVGAVEAAVDVRVVTDYGVSIPDLASAVRKNVSDRVHEMTGLIVKELNLEVVDLYFADDEPIDAPVSARVQ